jgi:hypothetical protein
MWRITSTLACSRRTRFCPSGAQAGAGSHAFCVYRLLASHYLCGARSRGHDSQILKYALCVLRPALRGTQCAIVSAQATRPIILSSGALSTRHYCADILSKHCNCLADLPRTAPRRWGYEHRCDEMSRGQTICQINVPPHHDSSAVAVEAHVSHGERTPRSGEEHPIRRGLEPTSAYTMARFLRSPVPESRRLALARPVPHAVCGDFESLYRSERCLGWP